MPRGGDADYLGTERWPHPISPTRLARLDAAIATVRDGAVRAVAHRLLEIGLSRRYNIEQLTTGFPAERYPGLIPLLAAAIPSSSVAVAPDLPASVDPVAAATTAREC